MKFFLPFTLALLSCGVASAASTVSSRFISGEAINSFSANGIWMVSETSYEGDVAIRNLETGQVWSYQWDNSDFGDKWDLPLTIAVSNDGTVISEYNNVPSYWTPASEKWTNLKGAVPSASGYVYAVLGGITPDGSMIVGSLGKRGGDIYGDGDQTMTSPCVWYRQDDGSYGDPVWLPAKMKDVLGRTPMYVNATSVSDDGKTVGVTTRDALGSFGVPYVYTLQSDGSWTSKMLGYSLINPNNLPIVPYPGDYHGADLPNYEGFMTSEQLSQFFRDCDARLQELQDEGYPDYELVIFEHEFAMEYMSPEDKAEYQPLLEAALSEFKDWQKKLDEYTEFLMELDLTAAEFIYNNVYLSPDGKYLFTTARIPGKNVGMECPVRFDVATGDHTIYSVSSPLYVTGVTADYSVLARYSNEGMAYIFPGLETTPKTFLQYFADNETIMKWMEENMYREVVTAVSATGEVLSTEEQWCMGKPTATPDMSLIGFAVDTSNWYPAPEDNSLVATFIINTSTDSGVETLPTNLANAGINILPGAKLEVKGDIKELTVYDISGTGMLNINNPSGVIETGLPKGIYIIKADGLTLKAAF